MVNLEYFEHGDNARLDADREPALLDLLAEATGEHGEKLRQIARTRLPALKSVTARFSGELVAFAAYSRSGDGVTIEYLAVDEKWRGIGVGRRLIHALADRHPDMPVVAETDDDAVEFYRRLGFIAEERARDDRWAERQRYRCVRAPSGEARR